MLRADDALNRTYVSQDQAATLFVAYFGSQRAGVNPHSPKNCLPGAGWLPLTAGTLAVRLPVGRTFGSQPVRRRQGSKQECGALLVSKPR